MTLDDFLAMVNEAETPPATLSPELRALWFTKRDRWHDAHDVVNDLHTPMGSWIHAHLHRIEGDLGNAAFWYAKAGRDPVRNQEALAGEWQELVLANL